MRQTLLLAALLATTPAALALAWLLHHPAGIVPITGSGVADHIIQNCTADNIALTDVEWYSLLATATDLRSGATRQN